MPVPFTWIVAHSLADGAIVEEEIIHAVRGHNVGLPFLLAPDDVTGSVAVEVMLWGEKPIADQVVEPGAGRLDIRRRVEFSQPLGATVPQIADQVTVKGTFLISHGNLLDSFASAGRQCQPGGPSLSRQMGRQCC